MFFNQCMDKKLVPKVWCLPHVKHAQLWVLPVSCQNRKSEPEVGPNSYRTLESHAHHT